MNLKSIIVMLALLLVGATSINAQEQEQGQRRQRQRMDPTEMYTRAGERLAKQMKLDDEKKQTFLVLYLDYMATRQNAGDPKGEELNGQDEKIDMKKLTDAQATELIQKQFTKQEKQLAVDKEYYAKFLEILTPAQTAQIYLQQGGQRGGFRQNGGEGGGQRGGMGGGPRGGGMGGNGGGFGGGDF